MDCCHPLTSTSLFMDIKCFKKWPTYTHMKPQLFDSSVINRVVSQQCCWIKALLSLRASLFPPSPFISSLSCSCSSAYYESTLSSVKRNNKWLWFRLFRKVRKEMHKSVAYKGNLQNSAMVISVNCKNNKMNVQHPLINHFLPFAEQFVYNIKAVLMVLLNCQNI